MNHKMDYEKIAEGMGLPVDKCIDCLEDGRMMGRIAEYIYAEKTNGIRCDSENSPYDVNSNDGKRVEVRSITKNGVSFASSKEVGYGRSVTKEGFKEKLNSVDYYICVDFTEDNNLRFIKITKDDIIEMECSGMMRKNKSVNINKFMKYVGLG